ncbi:MAG: hypothetical protein HY699_25140 [Deltaproteobacteria bacterium]|nr:hypothetical protein [Deltaproteobacteria bacterium]
MTRAELEHVLRAAADIANDDHIVVIGSQALLAQFPDAPALLRASVEADVFPLSHPERADLIDGSIGELSPFHATYGYYAQGVDEATAVLPVGWRERLVPIRNENTRGVTGLCLEVHDLLIAKAIAGRDKDRQFVREAIRHRFAEEATLLARLAEVPELAPGIRERVRAEIEAAFKEAGRPYR